MKNIFFFSCLLILFACSQKIDKDSLQGDWITEDVVVEILSDDLNTELSYDVKEELMKGAIDYEKKYSFRFRKNGKVVVYYNGEIQRRDQKYKIRKNGKVLQIGDVKWDISYFTKNKLVMAQTDSYGKIELSLVKD